MYRCITGTARTRIVPVLVSCVPVWYRYCYRYGTWHQQPQFDRSLEACRPGGQSSQAERAAFGTLPWAQSSHRPPTELAAPISHATQLAAVLSSFGTSSVPLNHFRSVRSIRSDLFLAARAWIYFAPEPLFSLLLTECSCERGSFREWA